MPQLSWLDLSGTSLDGSALADALSASPIQTLVLNQWLGYSQEVEARICRNAPGIRLVCDLANPEPASPEVGE